MTALIATFACFGLYLLGYHLYAKFLGRRVFQLDPDRPTPAHELRDGIDYVPSNRYMLFGHHYASIAGLSPMLGPAIAVIWGWLPAMLWVVLGTLFIGAVHDFSALVVSMRARGMSVGKAAEEIIGRRAKTLFHIIIFFLIGLGMGVFVHVCATLLSAAYNPEAVYPSATLMLVAVGVGWRVYRRNARLGAVTAAAFAITLASVWAGTRLPVVDLSVGEWSVILLVYSFAASVLPVWLLLQPRDYWYTAAPMLFMLATTMVAMLIKMRDFWNLGAHLLLLLGAIIFLLSLWLGVEAALRIINGRQTVTPLEAPQYD